MPRLEPARMGVGGRARRGGVSRGKEGEGEGRERGRNGDGGEQLQYVAAGRLPEKVKDEKGRED